jgi:hypothetical protein
VFARCEGAVRDACVNNAVSSYLATGRLPAADLSCA